MTKPILEEISAEKEMRELEEARKRYRLDVNTAHSVGVREGEPFGAEKIVIELICRNHLKGRPPEDIADILGERMELIETVLTFAKQLNSYDAEKIYESLKSSEAE